MKRQYRVQFVEVGGRQTFKVYVYAESCKEAVEKAIEKTENSTLLSSYNLEPFEVLEW